MRRLTPRSAWTSMSPILYTLVILRMSITTRRPCSSRGASIFFPFCLKKRPNMVDALITLCVLTAEEIQLLARQQNDTLTRFQPADNLAVGSVPQAEFDFDLLKTTIGALDGDIRLLRRPVNANKPVAHHQH